MATMLRAYKIDADELEFDEPYAAFYYNDKTKKLKKLDSSIIHNQFVQLLIRDKIIPKSAVKQQDTDEGSSKNKKKKSPSNITYYTTD